VSGALLIIHNVAPLWLLALWLGCARWVQLDAQARLANPSGIKAATAAAILLPFLGPAFWLCLRPAETRIERRERRLARRFLESAGDVELRRVGEPDRLRPRRDEAPEPVLDLTPTLRRRRGDEADGEEAVDEPVRVELLAVR
jgi:hypothetical protein